MDRMLPSEGSDAGSIPAESISEQSELMLESSELLQSVQEAKGFSLLIRR